MKKYRIMVQLDSVKEAATVAAIEGYGEANLGKQVDDVYRNNKVRMTIPTERNYWSAAKRSLQYSKYGILNCIIKV